MSTVSVEAAIAKLLSDGYGPTAPDGTGSTPGPIAQIDQTYSMSLPNAGAPGAVIWSLGDKEHRTAGGPSATHKGAKESTYSVLTHLYVYGTSESWTPVLFKGLVDNVKALYRTAIDLKLFANLTNSVILKFADEMETRTPQPATISASGGIRAELLALQAVIVTNVVEWINA
jgi:hypothetical protein